MIEGHTSTTTMTLTPPVKKACDACHRRKVRCSGGLPCKNCGQSSLQCTYLAVPQKKGPKGSRAKVITEIRDTQKHAPPPTTITTQTSIQQDDAQEGNPFNFNTPPMSPTANARNLDLLSPQTVDSCINFFFSDLYPTMPIFSRQHLTSLALEYRHGSSEVYCLVLSLCAFIMVQPGMSFVGMPMPASYEEDPQAARYQLADLLLKEVHRIRKNIEYVEYPTVHSVQIAFFLFCSYFGLDKLNQCWYHLREASTLAHMLDMNEEATYKVGDLVENIRNRRFYWLVLVTERAHSIQRHKPLSMLATIELPAVDEDSPEAPVLRGFVYLATIFRIIDDEFMALWNKAKSECSTSYLTALQNELASVLPPTLECTENQAADVKVTQHWLRCMVWQLSITNGHLSSNSPDIVMTFRYPIEIAKDLIRDIGEMNLAAMEVHGLGLIEKLFDISCTLSDVIAFVPQEPMTSDSSSPQHYLNQLLNLISRLRGGASRYVPLLMAKVAENVPSMPNPLKHMPQTLEAYMQTSPSTQSSPQDIKIQPQIQQPPQHIQIPSPQQSFHGLGRPSPFPDHVGTPQSQTGRLMFESYSPSVASHTELAMTPPIHHMPRTPQSQYGPSYSHIQQPQPRSVPAMPGLMKHDSWDSYSG